MLLAGAKFEKGFFVEPTLFDNVKPDMRVAQEEIFGPVLSVIEFTDVDEAIRIANGTRYGLGAPVWTRDIQRAIQLARSIESGQVYVNQYGSSLLTRLCTVSPRRLDRRRARHDSEPPIALSPSIATATVRM